MKLMALKLNVRLNWHEAMPALRAAENALKVLDKKQIDLTQNYEKAT
jgi:hypothetical protein